MPPPPQKKKKKLRTYCKFKNYLNFYDLWPITWPVTCDLYFNPADLLIPKQ